MNRAVIPLAAAITFVAVYRLTPVAGPAVQAAEPATGSAEASAPGPVERAGLAAAAEAKVRKPSRRRAKRALRPAARAVRATAPARPVVRVYFPGCNAVRAAGLAPLYRGQPGYRPEMDGDDDGIACEPHRRR
jgi:hypothetical protein